MRAKLLGLALVAALAGSAAAAPAPPPVEAYGALPMIESLVISPGGDKLAMIFHKGDQRAFVVRSLVGDKRVLQSLGLADSKARGARWADNDHLFVSLSRTANIGIGNYGSETGVVYLVNTRTGKSTVVSPSDDVAVHSLPLLSFQKNGHSYSFVYDDKGVGRLDLDTLQEVNVLQRRQDESGYTFAPDGTVVARTERLDYGRRWRVLAGANSDRVLAQGQADVGGGEVLGLGRQPGTVLVSSTEDGDFEAPREISVADGKTSEPLVSGAAATPIHDPKTHLLIGFDIGGAGSSVHFLDPAVQAKWASVRAAFRGEEIDFASTDDAFDKWVVRVEGPHSAGRYFLIDVAARQALPLGEAYPGVPSAAVGEFGWFAYKAADGTALKAVVTLPPGYTRASARNLPVVVMPHGGPKGHDEPRFDWWAQAIASRGYVVLQPNFRGSDGFGVTFERAGWGQWGKLMQTDVSDGLKALAATAWSMRAARASSAEATAATRRWPA